MKEPETLVRLRAAAAAVGVDEEELKRRAQAAGVKIHTVVRAGEAQAALDLDEVWRLRTDAVPQEPVDGHPSGVEVARLAARLEKEAAEHRAHHEEALEKLRELEAHLRTGEQSLRVEKSRQAQLESQLSESARTLAETQRALMELRTTHAGRERELKAALEAEQKLSATSVQAAEAAKLQAESAAGGRAHAEKRLEEAASALSASKDELSALQSENERLGRELAEVKALRAKLSELEGSIVKLNATVAREQADAKAARELGASKEAEAARLAKELERLPGLEKQLAEEQASARTALEALRAEHAAASAKQEAAAAKQRTTLEHRLKESDAAHSKADAARAIFERELGLARGELEKLEESCTRAALEREGLKQRVESLSSQLASATEGEKAIQRYADRKEAELDALRDQLRAAE